MPSTKVANLNSKTSIDKIHVKDYTAAQAVEATIQAIHKNDIVWKVFEQTFDEIMDATQKCLRNISINVTSDMFNDNESDFILFLRLLQLLDYKILEAPWKLTASKNTVRIAW